MPRSLCVGFIYTSHYLWRAFLSPPYGRARDAALLYAAGCLVSRCTLFTGLVMLSRCTLFIGLVIVSRYVWPSFRCGGSLMQSNELAYSHEYMS